MSPQPPRLRVATQADVRGIAELQVASWRAAYGPLFTAAERRRLRLGDRLAAWRARIEGHHGLVILAEVAPRHLAGFVALAPAEDDDLDNATVGEITSLHVDAGHRGHGVGRTLLGAGEAALRELGRCDGVLWVLTANEPARAFYEHVGWQADGAAVRRPMGGEPQLPIVDEVRYRRSL